MQNNIPRPEYPRPQLVRTEWINLNGVWDFEMDAGMSGKDRDLMHQGNYTSQIVVPFCPESKLSGIEHKDFMNCIWYKKEIELPDAWIQDGRVILQIGACDYLTEVYINGNSVGTHTGGYSAFSFDITEQLHAGSNRIVICAEDQLRKMEQPSGKQSKRYYSAGCDYTRTTGIWQTVWLEHVPNAYISSLKMTPDIDRSELILEASVENGEGMKLYAEASFSEKVEGSCESTVYGNYVRLTIKLSELHLWEIGNPALYDLKLQLGSDCVKSYFGMRSVSYSGHTFCLNHKPVFMRLVLDQGFYPDGIYTAPTDEALEHDIKLSMAMGFNGARLHQKVFEPRFLYHCDQLGYIVWGEHANWGLDLTKISAWKNFPDEWLSILRRDYNHPSIIGWCPFNETQKNEDRDLIRFVYEETKAFDPQRPVIDCSGYCHVKTDIVDWHDYEQNPDTFRANYAPLAEGKAAVTHAWEGITAPDPLKLSFISEYGGTWWSIQKNAVEGWGYGKRPEGESEVLSRIKGLTEALLENPGICGFCYTQLTDIEQEQNGLYTYERIPKFDPAVIHAILSQKAAIEK